MKLLSLRGRLVICVLFPLIVSSGILWIIALRQFEAILRSRMELDVRVVSQAVQPALGEILRGDRSSEALQAFLSDAFDATGDYVVFVYDRHGEIVARAGNFEHVDTTIPGATKEGLKGFRGGVYSVAAGESVYSYFAPLVTEEDRVAGMLQVAKLRRDHDRFMARLRLEVLATLLVGTLVLIGIVAVGYQRAIGKSLEALNASMRRIKQGERNHRASPGGPLEVAGLGETLNRMLDSIEAVEREIRSRKDKERKLSEQLRQSEKLASLGNISAGVAHELGTPLSVVVGNAQRGLRQENNPPKSVEAFHAIRAEVERMDRIVHQLLEFGRPAGDERRRVAPAQLARSALNSVEAIRRETGGTIEVADDNVAGLVRVHPVRVEIALTNLLKNALEASPGGNIRFSWTTTPEDVCFEVTDDGPGVEEEMMDKLFEPFVSTKGPNKGVGLGLSIVAQVANECGGSVRLASKPGEGACFRFTIPLDHDRR